MKTLLFIVKRLILGATMCLSLTSIASANTVNTTSPELIKAMQSGGHILMMRHENAPGYGDPDDIKINDCSTQRNLDDLGRQQSKKFGAWLRQHNIEASAVYSSQWCRCLETARLLAMGEVKELTALNSFFQMPATREPNLKALTEFIAQQKNTSKLIIMVTHFVTIEAITGKSLASGDAALIKLNGSDTYKTVGIVKND